MAAQSLYRRYRPQRFGELVGQEHVTLALRNAVREGRVGHAYLFSGPRGTGKTTTARILAKALNCTELGSDGEPCGTCENCTAIADGRFLDLFELDAASNNSVDNIRSLIETVNLGVGAGARTKVYLIDEVHMLSAGASNALLKTLEEPPGHVVFVLATTNPEKVLPTIRSRTQHFEFGLLTAEELERQLLDVLEQEQVEFERPAVELVARRAAGSARDALSLLDQALAHGDRRLSAEQTNAALGGLAREELLSLLECVAAGDAVGVLVALHHQVDAGHDARRIADDILVVLRDAFLASAAAGRVRVDAPPDELARLREVAAELGNALLARAIETLGQAIVDMRSGGAPDAQLVLEVALLRLARRDTGPAASALAERLERVEHELAELRAGGAPAPAAAAPETAPASADPAGRPTIGALKRRRAGSPAPATPPREPAAAERPPQPAAAEPERLPSPPEAPEAPAAPGAAAEAPFELDDVVVAWAATLEGLPNPVRRGVEAAQPVGVAGNVITFGIPPTRFEACGARFRHEAVAIRQELTARLGTSPRFSLVAHDAITAPAPAVAVPPAATAAPATDAAVARDPLDDDDVDLDELLPAPPDAPAVDSVSRLRDAFGATVVEERARETR